MTRRDALSLAISELERDRESLQAEIESRLRRLRQINDLVAGLRAELNTDGDSSLTALASPLMTAPTHTFANTTVRDGIKTILGEQDAGLTTAELADRLREGGMKSKGKDFLSNVSATLSMMAKRHREVFHEAGRWYAWKEDEGGPIDDATPF